MNSKFIQDNLIWIILPILVIGIVIYYVYMNISEIVSNNEMLVTKREEKVTKEAKLSSLMRAKEEKEYNQKVKKISKSGKVIYEVLGQQFSPEASFGIMFENVLSNVATSGIRIRSIDYNYHPVNDKVLLTNAPGYNACELSFTTVGNYNQFQKFFKNLAKENYLSNIYEVYIEPYEKNKNILIAKFKIRLYTKTVNELSPVVEEQQ